MRLEVFRVFSDVVKWRSLDRAAELNGLSQTNVSQMVRALEQTVGAPLVAPAAGGLQLTAEGRICHEHCHEIGRLYDAMCRQMQRAREIFAGGSELATCYSIGMHFLPSRLASYRKTVSNHFIEVRYGTIHEVEEFVRENIVDFGLVTYPRHLHGLNVETFRREPLMLVCSPEHPLSGLPAVTLENIKHQPIIAWTEISWPSLLNLVPDHQRHLFEPKRECDNVCAVKRLVQNGEGIAVLPEMTVTADIAHGRLAAIPFEGGRHFSPLAVIHRKGKKLTPAMKQFMEFLKS